MDKMASTFELSKQRTASVLENVISQYFIDKNYDFYVEAKWEYAIAKRQSINHKIIVKFKLADLIHVGKYFFSVSQQLNVLWIKRQISNNKDYEKCSTSK